MWYLNNTNNSLHEVVHLGTVKGQTVALIASYTESKTDAENNISFTGVSKIVVKKDTVISRAFENHSASVDSIHTAAIALKLKNCKLVRRSDFAGIVLRAQSLLDDYPELSAGENNPDVISLKKNLSTIHRLMASGISVNALISCTSLKYATKHFNETGYPPKASFI